MERTNLFKKALHAGQRSIGLWSTLHDPAMLEISASSGFDWILLDAEHSPADDHTVLAALQATAPHPSSLLVRPPQGDEVRLKKLLDLGVQSLLIPMVETADQARGIASAINFPPLGSRGVSSQTRAGNWGRDPEYLATARDHLCLMIQIESMIGVTNLVEILSVDGIDAVFVGQADLAASMGHLGNPTHPDVLAQVELVVAATTARGIPLGTLTRDASSAHKHLERGYSYVGVGTDSALYGQALKSLRQQFP